MSSNIYTKSHANEMAKDVMNKDFIALDEKMSVSDAITEVRGRSSNTKNVYTIYVVRNDLLVGVLSLRELLVADKNTTLENVMNTQVVSVGEQTDQEEVAYIIGEKDFYSVPVVDTDKKIVGIVTVNDALDIEREETTEDIYKFAGINISKASKSVATDQNKEKFRSNILINGRFGEIMKIRFPILLLSLLSGFVAGFIIQGFEEQLGAVTAIAFFIPVIMDVGGSVGSQTTTLFARGFVLGHIKPEIFWKQLGKEALVGLSMGLIIGIATFIGAMAWMGNFGLAISVAVAISANAAVASVAGFLVPMVLLKLGFDQAAGSSPIITNIKDITGLLVYFGCIILFLNMATL